MATIGCAGSAVAALDKETIRYVNQLRELAGEVEQLFAQVGRSPKLQQIAAVCGRFTRIALQQQKTRVKHPPDEITSITTGCEIERLLPSEIALLADPDLEDLFYLKFAERSLTQYDLIGHEPEGQRPIILAIDESESMTANYGGLSGEVWSKAVMLALRQ
jgi:uncharacterized protein with von Willebrand factor type A (vWA) domain